MTYFAHFAYLHNISFQTESRGHRHLQGIWGCDATKTKGFAYKTGEKSHFFYPLKCSKALC